MDNFSKSTFVYRPFRIYDPQTNSESYDRVLKLSKGKIYQQVNKSVISDCVIEIKDFFECICLENILW